VNTEQCVGKYDGPLEYSFMMGVEPVMPSDPERLPVCSDA